jgi:hypothetical protein
MSAREPGRRPGGAGRRRAAGLLVAAALALTGLMPVGTARAADAPAYDPAATWDSSPAPYLGWSSWSLQATRAAGLNPNGSYSWLTEDNLLAQVDVMATKLKDYGYQYINIDAGWWRTWNWTPVYDEHGRAAVWPTRFPSGMKSVVDYIHSKGLKVGIYMPAGLETGKEGDTAATGQDLTKTVAGAPQCTLADVIYPDKRLTNGWQSAYQLDFTDGDGCAQAYVNSMVDLFESWGGVDLIKVDGVGPGSGHTDISGANARYDNRAEIAAYDKAFQATGHHVEIQVSWAVSQDYITDWQTYADSWRSDWDVECYCSTLTTWSSASNRLANALDWAEHAGPDTGWTNLDSLEVGSGALDGLTDTERRSVTGIWSIASAPLYLGDDLTKLDDYGLSLVTNRAVLAVDQDPLASTLALVSQDGGRYVVSRRLADGDVVVGVFNLGDAPATIGTSVTDAATAAGAKLAARKSYAVTDLWSHETTQTTGRIVASVPAHGSTLYRISADPGAVSEAPSAALDLAADQTTLAPGGTTTVTATLTNTSSMALTGASVALSAPAGWGVERLAGTTSSTLVPGSATSSRFRVTAPAATVPIATAAVTGTATFTGHDTTRTATASVGFSLVSPVTAPLATANTTGADATFGQLGSALAISAAGTNVGPASGGAGGTVAGGDAYGAIYLPGSADTDDVVSASVTGQGGGSSAKAGVLVRDDMDAGGTPVGVALYVSNGRVSLVYNNTATGGTAYTTRVGGGGGPGGGTLAFPVTLRLARSGSTYVGSYSTNGGSTWTTVGTVTANGQGAAQDAGVFQSAGSATTPSLATFTDLSVS